MFEAGRSTALSRKTIEHIADVLEIDIAAIEQFDEEGTAVRELALKYCPIDGCPLNVPYTVGDRLCLKPTLARAPREQKTRCRMCGELMETVCPNAECGVPVVEGSHCPECGTPYVPVTSTLSGWQVTQWADEQREKIREIREMSRTVSSVNAS